MGAVENDKNTDQCEWYAWMLYLMAYEELGNTAVCMAYIHKLI